MAHDDESDASIMGKAAGGDPAAFDALVRRWKNRIYRLALRFFRRPEDAEDVTQEVFLKLYRAAATYRSGAPLEHYLMKIATNACLDRLRERRRRPEQVLSGITPDAGAWLDRALAGVALETQQAEAAKGLAAELLATLPPKDRTVLVLLDLEGLSTQEVAAATGSTRAAVKVRAMRARRALRRIALGLPRGGRP